MPGFWIMLIILLISSIPVIAVYAWFRLAEYPFSVVRFLLALLAGAASFFPALVLQPLINFTINAGSRIQLFYHVFVRIAFTEELSRLLLLFIFFIISGRITQDGIGQPYTWGAVKKAAATGLIVGLGFAILENAVYSLRDIDFWLLLLRAVTAAPLHAACGARVGMSAIMFKDYPFQAILRLLTATAIHGIYNFMIVVPGIPSILAILIALTALASSIMVIRGSWTVENKDNED
jgi:RsiW-degrading membrane proteinase PrsW (M82 family)